MAATGSTAPLPRTAALVAQNDRALSAGLRLAEPARCPGGNAGEVCWLVPFDTGSETAGLLQFWGPGESRSGEPRTITDEDLCAVLRDAAQTVRTFFDRAAESALAADPQAVIDALSSFCRQIHGSLDRQRVAANVVNEARRLLGCDRVTLLERRGGRYHIVAISGQKSIHPRSETVRSLAAIVDCVAPTGERFLSDGSTEELPETPARLLTRHLERSGARLLIVDPLIAAPNTPPSESARGGTSRPFAALVYEQFDSAAARPRLMSWSPSVTQQAALAFGNARRHDVLPGGRLLRRCLAGWRTAAVVRHLLAAAALTAAVGFVLGVSVDDPVEARGAFHAATTRGVFAPEEGVVVEVLVQPGETVEAGQPIVRLESDGLNSRRILLAGRFEETRQAAAAIRSELNLESGSREARLRLQAEAARLNIELRGLEEERRLLERRHEALTLRAPIRGTATDPAPGTAWLGRPVPRGAQLFEVADEQGAWRLLVEVPERAVGRVESALAEGAIPILYRADADPLHDRQGTLHTLATRAVPAGQSSGPSSESPGAVIVAEIAPAERGPGERLGGNVTVRIPCGPRALLTSLFGDTLSLLRQRLWW